MIGKLYKDQIGKKIRFSINVIPPHDGNVATTVVLNIAKSSPTLSEQT